MSLGPSEIVVVVLVALVVLGPDKLPQAVRTVSKYLAEFRKFSAAVQSQVDEALRVQPEPETPKGPEEPRVDAEAGPELEAETEAAKAEATEKPANPDVSGFTLIDETRISDPIPDESQGPVQKLDIHGNPPPTKKPGTE